MALTLVTAPDAEPLSLADAKLHLRVDVDDENTLIQTLIESAREYVETHTRRALIRQTWDLVLDRFCVEEDGALWLPKAPVSSITSVTYVDAQGVTQTWHSDYWDADLPAGPKARRARLYPTYGQSWPTPRCQPNAVTVRFVSGYGTAGDQVPSSLRAAMLLLIGHWFAQRETVNVGNAVTEIPVTVEALLAPFRAD